MKYKLFIPITLSIILGITIGKIFFQENKEVKNIFYEGEKIYLIELGTYETKENLDDTLTILENDGYHLYAGITKNEQNKDKIINTYKDNNIKIIEKSITNTSFLDFLNEYDKILSIVDKENDIKTIEEIIIRNYKEMVLSVF